MLDIPQAMWAGQKAGHEISISEYPETVFGKWMKANVRLCTIVKGELMTFVEIGGLNYMSEALQAFKASPEYAEMCDIAFSGYNLYVAFANDYKA